MSPLLKGSHIEEFTPGEPETPNSARIREALEKAIVWADVDYEEMNRAEARRREHDIALALAVLQKWREEEA